MISEFERAVQYMELACEIALSSSDPSVQNGAVVVTAGGTIASGYNDLTRGVQNTEDKWVRPEKYLWVEHAERAAILHAAAKGVATQGAEMFCPWASCADCARAIVESGIATLYRLPMGEADGWTDSIRIGDEIMMAASVNIRTLPLENISIPDGLRLGQFRA